MALSTAEPFLSPVTLQPARSVSELEWFGDLTARLGSSFSADGTAAQGAALSLGRTQLMLNGGLANVRTSGSEFAAGPLFQVLGTASRYQVNMAVGRGGSNLTAIVLCNATAAADLSGTPTLAQLATELGNGTIIAVSFGGSNVGVNLTAAQVGTSPLQFVMIGPGTGVSCSIAAQI